MSTKKKPKKAGNTGRAEKANASRTCTSLYLPKESKTLAMTLAKKENRSLSNFICEAIQFYSTHKNDGG